MLVDLAARFEGRLDSVATANAGRQREEIEGLRSLDAPALWEANRRLTRESRRLQASHLVRGQELPGSCPEPDVEAARLAVRGGLSLADFLKCYRIGHSCTWDAWLEVIEQSDAPLALKAACMATLSRFVSSYDDRLADLVAQEYQQESDRAKPSPARTRLRLFRDLIEGKAESVDGLDYALEANHIGIIAWGINAQKAFAACAKTLDGRSISVPAEHGLVMGWVGVTRQLADAERRALRTVEPLVMLPWRLAVPTEATRVCAGPIAKPVMHTSSRCADRRRSLSTKTLPWKPWRYKTNGRLVTSSRAHSPESMGTTSVRISSGQRYTPISRPSKTAQRPPPPWESMRPPSPATLRKSSSELAAGSTSAALSSKPHCGFVPFSVQMGDWFQTGRE